MYDFIIHINKLPAILQRPVLTLNYDDRKQQTKIYIQTKNV